MMSSSSKSQHGGSGNSTSGNLKDVPVAPEPSFAERVRSLLYLERIGSLSTLSRKQPGFPFGSVMPFAVDDQGRPIFLISTMAMHTQNVQADQRASLLVTQSASSQDPLGSSRVTLIGNVLSIPNSELAGARDLYLSRYVDSKYWVDYADFSFWRMEPVDVYYVGGFGVMGWVSASDYQQARPDPLADSAAEIIRHMNADHGDALILIAHKFAGIEALEVTMTAVDRLGFQARMKTSEGVRGLRIAFLRAVANTNEARKVLVEMTRQARGLEVASIQEH